MRSFVRLFFFFSLPFYMTALEPQPFVTVRMHCQLGNRMFQIAAATAFALDNDFALYCPDLKSDEENRDNVFRFVNAQKPEGAVEYVYEEGGRIRFPIPVRRNMRMEGYFQSQLYFSHHKKEILRLFAPPQDTLDYLQDKYSDILSHPCTVAVHVRTYLKDYGHLPTMEDVHAFVGVAYYEKAVQLFPSDALFVICSDDTEWCKEHLAHIAPHIVFIEGNRAHHDLYLMSLCHHNITANSTFSWWSAYLNCNPNKLIVTVDRWFGKEESVKTRDIVPRDWIKISR